MNKFIYYFGIVFLLIGCSGEGLYPHPKSHEPHALITPIVDETHSYDSPLLDNSTIWIQTINGMDISEFSKARNVTRIIKPGEVTVYVEEDPINGDVIHGGILTFTAKANMNYIISSKHIKKDGRVIDINFMIIHNGKVITKVKSEKIKRPTHLYVPIII